MSVLDVGPVAATRRNHGIEHATIRVLAERYPSVSMAGRSDWGGFYLLGDIPTDAIGPAVEEAMRRVRDGQRDLVVHPNCGTNLVVTGLLAGVASFTAAAGPRDERMLDKLPRMVLASTVAILLAQPLGPKVQEKFTTSADFGDAYLKRVKRQREGRVPVHRVEIGDGPH
ncbi:MAG: DUF6391 domain-containing protein [Anaerolineae bacterium]